MISLPPQTKAYIIALVPLGGAVLSALAVVEIAGPTYTTAVNQAAILMRFLWGVIFPFLMIPFIFWARRVAERKWRATIFSVVILLLAGWFNYLLLA